MKTKTKKPNGVAHDVFIISIDDGYVEYSYPMNIGEGRSIVMIERKIRKALRCKKAEGSLRTSHYKPAPPSPRPPPTQRPRTMQR